MLYLRRATCLHGISTSRSRRRRGLVSAAGRRRAVCSCPRNIHVAAAASPRLVTTKCPHRSRGVAATGPRKIRAVKDRRPSGPSTGRPRPSDCRPSRPCGRNCLQVPRRTERHRVVSRSIRCMRVPEARASCSAEYPRGVVTTSLRNIHAGNVVAAAASPRPVFGISTRRTYADLADVGHVVCGAVGSRSADRDSIVCHRDGVAEVVLVPVARTLAADARRRALRRQAVLPFRGVALRLERRDRLRLDLARDRRRRCAAGRGRRRCRRGHLCENQRLCGPGPILRGQNASPEAPWGHWRSRSATPSARPSARRWARRWARPSASRSRFRTSPARRAPRRALLRARE